jgi:hypothetical protein
LVTTSFIFKNTAENNKKYTVNTAKSTIFYRSDINNINWAELYYLMRIIGPLGVATSSNLLQYGKHDGNYMATNINNLPEVENNKNIQPDHMVVLTSIINCTDSSPNSPNKNSIQIGINNSWGDRLFEYR